MIDHLVASYHEHADELRSAIAAQIAESEYDIDAEWLVKLIARTLIPAPEGTCDGEFDPDRVTCIDHGDYQGTLLLVVGAAGDRPSLHWAVAYWYGSCSGCDTLQSIKRMESDGKISAYMTEVLHLVQGMVEIS